VQRLRVSSTPNKSEVAAPPQKKYTACLRTAPTIPGMLADRPTAPQWSFCKFTNEGNSNDLEEPFQRAFGPEVHHASERAPAGPAAGLWNGALPTDHLPSWPTDRILAMVSQTARIQCHWAGCSLPGGTGGLAGGW